MGNRNRHQSDWNNRENRFERGRWDQRQEQNRPQYGSNYGDYGRSSEFSSEPYGREYGQNRGQRSLREEQMRNRGYYGLQQGREDLSEFDRFGQNEDWNQGRNRGYSENQWGRDRESGYGQGNFGSNYGRDYGQNFGQENRQDYDRGFGQQNYSQNYGRQNYGQDYGRDFDRDRYQGNRFVQQEQGFSEDWNRYGSGYGSGERWRGSANWGQGRHEGSFDRDRSSNQARYGSQEWARDYDRDRDDESLGDKIGRFFGVGPKGWKRSDDRVRDDVSERLEQDPRVDASNIEVKVQDGEVTLTGNVPDRQTKRLAEDVAENCRGVKDVHNQLRVQSEVSSGITGSTTRAGVSSETSGTGGTKRSAA